MWDGSVKIRKIELSLKGITITIRFNGFPTSQRRVSTRYIFFKKANPAENPTPFSIRKMGSRPK
jgi:hypothetical protein